MRQHFGKLSGNAHLDTLTLPGARVEQVQRAELLPHDGVGTRAGGLEVQAAVLHRLGDLVGLGIVHEQADGTAAVGKEVDLVAGPHGIEIVRVVARNFFDMRVGERSDPDGHRLAAAIPLPRGLPLEFRGVRDLRAIGRERTARPHGQGQFGGKTTLHRHGEQLRCIGGTGAGRGEQHILAVRTPPGGHIRGGMPGETLGLAPGGGDDVNVGVAIVVGGESDPLSVGREVGIALGADAGGEPLGIAAVVADRPDIAGVAEGDLFRAGRGMPDQQRLVRGRPTGDCKGSRAHQQRQMSRHARGPP